MFTPVVQRRGKSWIGWVEGVPGVNSQAKTRKALLENLQSALQEALAMDAEQLELGSSDKFWRLITARRKEKTISRAALESAVEARTTRKK